MNLHQKQLMKPEPEYSLQSSVKVASPFRNWLMTTLTALFVSFYGAALLGWLKPFPDEQAVARLEPIIFVLIGYYFGRLPAQQNEQMLKSELGHQTQKTDAAQHAKEQALQAREALEEKVKNVKIVLVSSTASSAAGAANKKFAGNTEELAPPAHADTLRQKVTLAINILNSSL
jgi:hypothetical protein